MQAPARHDLAAGVVTLFTAGHPGAGKPNEDALGIVNGPGRRAAILLADGMGGQPAGDRASRLAIATLTEALRQALAEDGDLQAAILAGFDQANAAVRALNVGAATTLVVLEIDGDTVRPYHVGDSEVLIMGQRGRIKLQTMAHSPVGYRVQAGVLDHDEALYHDERHLISNMVGCEEMRIDVGPTVTLRPRDTVVVASDGLFDNLTPIEIIETARAGNQERATADLVRFCQRRMSGELEGPSKPDDLSVAVFRPARRNRG